MAKRCKVTGYLLSVRKLNARGPCEILGSFNGAEDVAIVLKKLIQKNSRNIKHKVFGKAYRFELDNTNDRSLSGHIYSGDYGAESEIYDTEADKISYKKKKNDADLHPLYFYIATNVSEIAGIICFEQFGLSGIKSIFEATIGSQFAILYPEYRLHIRSLTIADALQGYLNKGLVEELIIEKHEIPADVADKVSGKKSVSQGIFSYSIKPSSPAFFNKSGLIAYAKGESSAATDFDIDNHGFDRIKTKIRVGDTAKTFDLSKPDVLAMSVDITADVKFGDNGHPTTDSLRREFEVVAKDLAKRGNIKL